MPSFLSSPYASAAAVGSLTILSTSNPAIFPASLVACLCESLKYAGTVITAFSTFSPKYLSASSFSLVKMKAEIWEGEYFSPEASTHASPLSALTILYGTISTSFWTVGSSNDLPINLLMANRVFSGLVTACLFAGWPTTFSPSLLKPTIEGVVLEPSEFSITLEFLPSIIETQQLVVPKSIPITFDIVSLSFNIWFIYS